MDIEQLAGTRLGNYEIESLLGRGGMGVVYKARQLSLDRPVALKILIPTLISDSSFIKRFQTEAHAVARLSHSNIVQIFDITEEEGLHFFSMEYVEGRTLDDILKEKRHLDTDEAVRIISQAAHGIEHAHRNDIIHRDIKSSNIILDVDGNVKVMDFGLAKLVGRTKLTGTGTIMGTVDYMSPEQASGEPVDHRTDIWSLGVVLYEMLTGQTLFTAESDAALIYKIIYEEPTGVRGLNPDVPSGLSIVLARAMAKNKEDRYASISEFLGDIRDFKTLKRETRPIPMAAMEEVTAAFIAERTPFVGRNSERAELQQFLLQAARRQGSLVMIGGEPGVGKTRITEELVAEARRHGFLTLTGHCYEMEGAPPYIPFVEIIESSARIVERDALLAALGDSAPEVAKLVPELRQRFPDIPEPRKLPPEQERRYMFNGVLEFIARAAQEQPLFLVLEDLHWTDEPTLLLLQHIAQRLHEMPVLIVGTYRDTELDVARSLAKALEGLLRQRMAHDLILKRLPQEGVSAMLQGRSGQEPPSRLVEAIYHETEGNPFFVEEVFKHLAEEEKLFDAEGQWRTDLRIDELDVPRGVLLVIGHRLARVTQECRRTLTTAAVIGRAFGFQLLEELLDLDEDTVFDAIDDAERAQLIRSTTRGGEAQLMFAHELIRQTLLSDLSTPRRQRLHLRVGDAMERLYAGTLEAHAADLAYHFVQGGGDTEKIIEYAIMAAERATAQTAYEETVAQYRRALQALEQQQPIDELRRCDLLVALGHAYGNVGDPSRGKETFLKVTDIARKLPAAEQFADSVLGLCSLWQVVGATDVALLDLLEEGLALVPEEDSAIRAALLGRLSTHLALEGKQDRRIALSEQAVTMARHIGDPKALCQALLSSTLIWEHSLAQKIADATELAKLEEELGHPEGGYWGLTYLCHFHMEQGNVTVVDVNLAKLKKLATELSHPAAIWKVALIEAMLALMRGQFEDAEGLALEAFALGQKVSEENAAQYLGAFMYALRWLQGRLAEMEDAWKSAVQQYPEVTVYRSAYALMLKVLGREEEAREEMERLAIHNFADLPKYFLTLTELMFPSEVAVAFGDTRCAALLYDLLHPYADRVLVIAHHCAGLGAVTQWLGMLAATLKRWDAAVEHFEAALETNARIGARPFLARTQHEYARMLIERNAAGDKEKARELLSEATVTYRELGMPTFLENADELVENL